LLSTLEPAAGPLQYIGYQTLLGIGIGCGFHQPFIAVQAVLPELVSRLSRLFDRIMLTFRRTSLLALA
jgi:hypothetical protein